MSSAVATPRLSTPASRSVRAEPRPASASVRRIDVDEKRAQRLDAVAHLRGGAVEQRRVPVGDASLARRAGERKGDAGKVLDDAVMQVAGDAAALRVGGIEGLLQQSLTLTLAFAQPPGERPRDRDLDQLERDQRADRDRREALPDPGAGGGDGVVPVVSLEQQSLSAGRADREVDLEHLVERALETVLRFLEVTDLCLDHPFVRAVISSVAERVRRPLEPRLVGVDDLALASPDLHAHERPVEHAVPHHGVDALDSCRSVR